MNLNGNAGDLVSVPPYAKRQIRGDHFISRHSERFFTSDGLFLIYTGVNMKIVLKNRYIADCGKGFWSKSICESHEKVCTCWKNPKNRACVTCGEAIKVHYESDTGQPAYWQCKVGREHSGGPEGVDYLSVHCPAWWDKRQPMLLNSPKEV